MPPIQADGANEPFTGAELDLEGSANAFLDLMRVTPDDDDASKKKPSETDETEGDEPSTKEDEHEDNDAETDTDESEETPDEEGEEEGDETEETEGDEDKKSEAKKKYADDDETYVKIKVDDEEHEVPVKDLKRLWGQESALTRRSQEVAQKAKDTDAQAEKNIAAYSVLLKRAEERAAPFKQINWAGLMKDPTVTHEEVTALQTAAREAIENETFIKSELDGFMQAVGETQKTENAKQAQACIKALTSEKTEKGEANPLHISGWNETVYNDVRSFAVTMGMNKDVVNQLRDPAAFKMIHMAMQFQKGAAKVQTTKVNKAPKKIVKASSSPAAPTSTKTVIKTKAMNRLRDEQSQDAAADAFLAMMSKD
jgi:hypothetical protein